MVAGVLPSKYSSTFLGLIESYKAQMVKATNDEARAEKALTSIFKDMMTAYAGQICARPTIRLPPHLHATALRLLPDGERVHRLAHRVRPFDPPLRALDRRRRRSSAARTS